jgi:rhodanese-related sulfurtransferase
VEDNWMVSTQIQPYLIPTAFVGFFAWRFLKFRQAKRLLPKLLAQGAVVIDVRSAGEYASGAREGSVNIPLADLDRGAELLDRRKPVVVCCASGTRSGLAATLLRRKGFTNVLNAGPWRNTVVESAIK